MMDKAAENPEYSLPAAAMIVATKGKVLAKGFTGVAKKAKWVKSRQGANGPGLRDHFEKHGLAVGAKTAKQYDESARKTIQNGRKFSYRDRHSGESRVGYYDQEKELFTATSQIRGTPAIMSHFPETWTKLRKLPGFSVK